MHDLKLFFLRNLYLVSFVKKSLPYKYVVLFVHVIDKYEYDSDI